jgi:hypothetical protein
VNEIKQKSVLAKLLATEDIAVVHDSKMPTAAFDVKERTLYLPVFKKMSEDLYDLFIGHEVGHAHHTPEEGWHDAVCDTPELKGFYNIIEDARIERKIKAQYPGLASSFYKGYKELFDKDFFGIRGRDINTFPFADRINIHFKIGHMASVNFSETEKVFIERIAKAETWDDVKTLSQELAGISKEEAKERAQEGEELQKQLDELKEKMEGMRGEQTPNPEDKELDQWETRYEIEKEDREKNEDEDGNVPEDYEFDRYSDEVTKEVDERVKDAEKRREEFESTEKDLQELEAQQKELEEDLKFHEEEGQHSQTDSCFRKNEVKLVDMDAAQMLYVDLDGPTEPEDVIVPMNELYNWEDCVTREVGYDTRESQPEELKRWGLKMARDYEASNRPVINQMAQQFELRKAATGFKKARISKTGKLNEDKLWAYKLTEDLFQQTQVVPNGKNHGIIMYVDLSGSMCNHIKGTIEQAINVGMFCRKVGIPFDVYGFSDCGKRSERLKGKFKSLDFETGQFIDYGNVNLVHMISSKCKKTEWDNAMAYLMCMMKGYERGGYRYDDEYEYVYITNSFFRLGGTPLNHALAYAPKISKLFKKRYNVEILSTIFLTDGGATDNLQWYKRTETDDEGEKFVKVDYARGKQLVAKVGASTVAGPKMNGMYYERDPETKFLIEYYKKVTGDRIFNFHIVGTKRRDFESEYSRRSKNYCYQEFDKWYKTVLKNKFGVLIEDSGWDTSLIIKGQKDLQIDDQELEVKSNKRGDLLRGFKKFSGTKRTSRTFVNQIIDLVA